MQTVFIRSLERNAVNMYEARRRVLALAGESLPMICQPDEQLGDSCPHLYSNGHGPFSSGKMLVVTLQWCKVHWYLWILK